MSVESPRCQLDPRRNGNDAKLERVPAMRPELAVSDDHEFAMHRPRAQRGSLWWLANAAVVASFAFLALPTKPAFAAEHSIIKHPGDHPNYGVEIEPHLLAAFISPLAGDGFGLGARFSIPLVENGFIPSINNNAAIGFGVDWIHYSGCWRGWGWDRYDYRYGCPEVNTFYFPVVLQWNFFLSTHFSVFGEAGVGFNYTNWPNDCYYYDNRGVRLVANCGPGTGGRFDWDPFILMIGGRYHFSEKVALTGRLGFPYFSFGVSFYP